MVSNVDIKCSISGAHDIDEGFFIFYILDVIFKNFLSKQIFNLLFLGWMLDIHKNNSRIKFLPRFIFEEFQQNTIESFLSIEQVQIKCAREIIEFLHVFIIKSVFNTYLLNL